MTAYMLRDNDTGLYYRRTQGQYSPHIWVDQGQASIWSVKIGPAQAMSVRKKRARGKPINLEIVSFKLTEIK